MPATCIVRGCKSHSNQGCSIKFHRLPWRVEMLCKQWLIRAGKSELELTGKRMSQFKNARMCSLHFNADGEGTSTTLPSRNIPDFERQEAAAGLVQLAVPHMESNQRNVYGDQINPDNSTEDIGNILEAQPPLITPGPTPSKILKRKLFSDSASQVTPKRKTTSIGIQRTPGKQKHTQVIPKQKRSEKSSKDISISIETQTETPSSFYIKSTKTTQTDSKITCDKSSQVNISKIENLKSSDKELKRYTGIEDYKLFTILHKYLVSCCSHTECEIIPGHGDPNKLFSHIDSENQLLVLYKLKRNPIDSVIASDFNISTGRISEIFKFWIKRMYRKFKIIKIWPSKESIQKHMPLLTKQHFPDLVAIADCVEFSTQVPRCPIAGKQMFSNYKNCHTVKAMYTSAPNGALIHCSDMFGGNSSDKEISDKVI